jgi:hypothetical protein
MKPDYGQRAVYYNLSILSHFGEFFHYKTAFVKTAFPSLKPLRTENVTKNYQIKLRHNIFCPHSFSLKILVVMWQHHE